MPLTLPAGSGSPTCVHGRDTTGARSVPSAARRRRVTRSPGSRSSPATTRTTRRRSWPGRRRRHATGSPGCAPTGDVAEADIHLWQQSNPVVTEALVQLTWGGPQVIYNGGLQQARVRYYDAIRRRPGLPQGVAALVTSIDPEATVVELVNLGAEGERRVIVQSGAFAEHAIEEVRYTACEDGSWLGDLYDYGHGDPIAGGGAAPDQGTRQLPSSSQ